MLRAYSLDLLVQQVRLTMCVFVRICAYALQFHPHVATGTSGGAHKVPFMINSRRKLCSWYAHIQTTYTTRA